MTSIAGAYPNPDKMLDFITTVIDVLTVRDLEVAVMYVPVLCKVPRPVCPDDRSVEFHNRIWLTKCTYVLADDPSMLPVVFGFFDAIARAGLLRPPAQ